MELSFINPNRMSVGALNYSMCRILGLDEQYPLLGLFGPYRVEIDPYQRVPPVYRFYSPATLPDHGHRLIEEFGIMLDWIIVSGKRHWRAYVFDHDNPDAECDGDGPTILVAVCRAIIRRAGPAYWTVPRQLAQEDGS